jgi:DNA-binding PucR family transcriptional regulator
VADASVSADRARRTLALVGDPDRIAIAGDHLVTLLLHSDERLLADLRERALAPLASSKLTDTLHEFLRHQGRMDPTARALGVHPQTVRYRVARLRELLGGALDDPDRRLELQLALMPRPGRQAGRES